MTEEMSNRAAELGMELGRNAGSWVVDGNTSASTARAIVRGYEDGDPVVLDMEPSPLSGEWADGPFLPDVVEEITGDRDYQGDDLDDLLTQLEESYSSAFWAEVLHACASLV